MPKPNPGRIIASEEALARRVAQERERRGWTLDRLARAMTAAGCTMQTSAIHKIEKYDPPRRITVDELVAFSTVFEIPVQELLTDPELAAEEELLQRTIKWAEAVQESWFATERVETSWSALAAYVQQHDELRPVVEKVFQGWVDEFHSEPGRTASYADYLTRMTGDESYMRRLIENSGDAK